MTENTTTESTKSASIFDGCDEIIRESLGLPEKKSPNSETVSKPACQKLCKFPSPSFKPEIVPRLFEQIEANFENRPDRNRTPSKKNWRDKPQTDEMTGHNQSLELLLERAIANLADRGYLPDEWTNEIPVASGLATERSEALDLARVRDGGDTADLIELKWPRYPKDTNENPLSALFQVLRYGLVLLLSRKNAVKFGYVGRPLIKAKNVNLVVLAPASFYDGYNSYGLGKFSGIIESGLNCLSQKDERFPDKMSFQFKQFADDFVELPFSHGEEVNAMVEGDDASQRILAAVDGIHCLREAKS